MNIKGLIGNVIPIRPQKAEEAKAKTAFDADNEKEGNGQSSSGGDQRPRRNLTPEEIAEAVKNLENLEGVKNNGLRIRAETHDGVTVVYVEDRDGKVVRRIPESELSLLGASQQKQTGRLLNKAL
jgi:uncharacterized FlaG/YvyC family protein